jgi:hypothetical protein
LFCSLFFKRVFSKKITEKMFTRALNKATLKRKFAICFFIMTILSCKKSANVNIKYEKTNTEIESKFLNLDSIQNRNNKDIEISGNHVNKLIVSRKDSLIWITSSKYLDHRIFGYEKPNINSKKLILISCFTSDVENNPFGLPLGAYYELDINHKAKFLKKDKEFIVAKFILNEKDMENIYFEKKWIEFDD